jgi:hypothetical protein
VFVVPEWTRDLLLARLGKVGRDLTLPTSLLQHEMLADEHLPKIHS